MLLRRRLATAGNTVDKTSPDASSTGTGADVPARTNHKTEECSPVTIRGRSIEVNGKFQYLVMAILTLIGVVWAVAIREPIARLETQVKALAEANTALRDIVSSHAGNLEFISTTVFQDQKQELEEQRRKIGELEVRLARYREP